jgi:hypothetical protein
MTPLQIARGSTRSFLGISNTIILGDDRVSLRASESLTLIERETLIDV